MFKNLKLGSKLIGSFSAVVILTMLLGALAVFFGRERALLGSFGRRQFQGIVTTAVLNLLFDQVVPAIDTGDGPRAVNVIPPSVDLASTICPAGTAQVFEAVTPPQ